MSDSVDWGSLGAQLAKGAVGLLPPPLNTIGAALLPLIFPSASIDWNAIASSFSKAVQQDLDASFLEQTKGEIQGIVSYMATSYVDDKKGGESKDTLFNTDLEPQNQACYKLIGELQQDEYQQSGFGNFAVAAGIHLTILQEKALVDPVVTDPKSSGSATTLAGLAKQYIQYALRVKALLLQSRINQIGAIQFQSLGLDAAYYYTDSFTGATTTEESHTVHGDTVDQARQRITAAWEATFANATATFLQTVGAQIDTLISAWTQLSANPIPITS